MTRAPQIMMAPNGARRQKSDHPALPITPAEIAQTAADCHAAGADWLHLHIREADGRHSLDPGLYREVMAEVEIQAPGMAIQVTTESASVFEVPEQLRLMKELRPAAASVATREIVRSPELMREFYATAAEHGTRVQHILYDDSCFDRLEGWYRDGIVPEDMRDAITVLGTYSPAVAGVPEELPPRVARAAEMGLTLAVCVFGENEQACLLAAAEAGCDLRIGFENNLIAPDGTVWPDNAASVRSLKAALS